MADSDFKCKEHLKNFPTSSFLTSLISSFPPEWRCVFGTLNSERRPLYSATNWLKESISDKRKASIPPHWTNLLNHLSSEFPTVSVDEIYFKPKILLFPINLQRNILTFLIYHFEDMQLEDVENLVRVLDTFSSELSDWVNILYKHLKAKVLTVKLNQSSHMTNSNSELKQNTIVYAETVSAETRSKLDEICKKLLVKKPSESCPNFKNWFSVNSEFAVNTWNRKGDNDLANKYKDVSDEMAQNSCATKTGSEALAMEFEMVPTNDSNKNIIKESQVELICIDDESGDETKGKGDKEGPAAKRLKSIDDSESSGFTDLSVPPPPDNICDHDLEEEAFHTNKLLMSRVKPLMDLIQSLDSGTDLASSSQLSEQISNLCECSSTEVDLACQYLGLSSLTEHTTLVLCQQLIAMDTELSYSNTQIFASYLILTKLEGLEQPASRVLFSSVAAFAKKFPKAFCDGVAMDLLAKENLGTFQRDVICKVVKESFGLESVKYFFSGILQLHKRSPNVSWTENIIAIVQTIIDNKIDIDPSVFMMFSQVLEFNSLPLAKSLKFAKLVLAVINKYGTHVAHHYKFFEHILEKNSTFLKKAGLAALKKLGT